jgi:signal transduction histidine kinase
MGTWDWDLATNSVQWSDNLARIHGLPPGSFDGTFASYEREIHPDDRAKVFASVQRALAEGVPHDVEYRLVAPDGSIRWCEGKGRVEYDGSTPARMSGVCVIVTRRKEAELARLAAAEESARQKDEFLATLSHELRTPLNAIVGWVQLLQHGKLTEERTAHAINVIARNARLQAQLIDDILDVSRIITGKLEIERQPIAVAQLIDSVITGIAPLADAKGLAVTHDIARDLPPIEGDPRRLHQVLANVLTNAVKFTPQGGSIHLRCHASGRTVTIAVTDSGVGVPAEFLPFVFDRFRQADSQTTRQHGGLGLGLAIARYLVEQHGGAMRADSAGPGKGTTFSIELPSAIGAIPASPEQGADERAVRLDGLSILALDDQADSREMLAHVLVDRGARVVQADTADGALALLAQHPVDVIIADIAMPIVDGYEFMRRLRATGCTRPAVAVTAFARTDDRDRALQSGYSAFVTKPIDTALLVRAVRDCARR